MPHRLTATSLVRRILGTATIAFLGIGFLVSEDPRWFVAGGLTGILWTLWDIVWERLLAPFGDWLVAGLTGGLVEPRIRGPGPESTEDREKGSGEKHEDV